jgi:putative transport protein
MEPRHMTGRNRRDLRKAAGATIILITLLATVGARAAQGTSDAGGGAIEKDIGNVFQFFEPITETGLHGVFAFLGQHHWVFILLALAIGYPIGRIKFGPISVGTTAGVLLVAVFASMTAQVAFGLTYKIPDLVSTIFLTLFMYALGLGTGPKFFAGIRSSGVGAILIGLIVWSTNWIICFVGAKLAGLESGFTAGLISGSYTDTAVLGVASAAVQTGTVHIPANMTAAQVGANMAAAYAISYILSSVGTILLIRYLPSLFGHDPVADAKTAEQAFSGSGAHPLPGTPQAFLLGETPFDIRAYKVTHAAFVGKSVIDLFEAHPQAPVLKVVRDGRPINVLDNPTICEGDIVAIRAEVSELLLEGDQVGPEVDDPKARDVTIEAADVVVGNHAVAGQTVEQLARAHFAYGLRLSAIFRGGHEIPLGPTTDIRFHDVLRLIGPDFCIDRAAKAFGSRAITEKTLATTEVTYMAIAMLFGYLAGTISITVFGIPFVLGTSAGSLLAGILVAYLRSRSPLFGGPVSEGARSFLQDIGLNIFVAALGANVGPKIIGALSGSTVVWLALIGISAALLPVVIAFFVGDRLLKMNSIINAGACAGARNSTPSLNAILDQSKSQIAAVPFPVAYAITTVLVLIGGYVAQVLTGR